MKKFLVVSLVLALCMTGVVASAAEVSITNTSYADGVATVDVATEDANAVILVLEGEKLANYISTADIATLENEIVYVDQKATSASVASFNFLPNSKFSEEDGSAIVTVYASSTAATAVASQQFNLIDAVSYTVAYDAAGGEVSESSITFNEGEDIALAIPTWTGHKFLGWYFNEAKVESTADINADGTVVASWKELVVPSSSVIGNTAGENFFGGFYMDEENKYGVLSATAKVGADVETVTGYGFVLSAANTLTPDAPFTEATTDELKTDGFFSVVYKIPEANFDDYVTFKPFIQDAEGDWIFGTAVEIKVSEFDANDLGLAADLDFLDLIDNNIQ